MASDIFVSIILPTYNRAYLLPSAIESVLAQTYPYWELLVWDDGSIDETKAVVQTFQDARIQYFFASNHGKSYALNQALQKSRGKYIAFLDDDDQWTPNKLEIQVEILKQNPNIDLILGNFVNINKENNQEGLSFTQNAKGLAQLKTQKIGDGRFMITGGWLHGITTANFVAFDTVMMPSKTIDQVGQFNESLKASEDFEYWWRFGLAGLKAAYTEDILMKRIKIPGSLSSRSMVLINNHIKMLDTCTELSLKHGQPETVALLRPMYRNAWQNMITAFAQTGDWQGMLHAFKKANSFGFRPGSVRLFLEGLIMLGTGKDVKKR